MENYMNKPEVKKRESRRVSYDLSMQKTDLVQSSVHQPISSSSHATCR